MLTLWLAVVSIAWAFAAPVRFLWLRQRMSKVQLSDASQYPDQRVRQHAANVARIDLSVGLWLAKMSRWVPLLLILIMTLVWAEPVVARLSEPSQYVLVALGARDQEFQFVDLARDGVVVSDVPLVIAEGEVLAVGQQLQVMSPPALWADWVWYTEQALADVSWLRGVVLPWLALTGLSAVPAWQIFRGWAGGVLTPALVDSARRIQGATVCRVPRGSGRSDFITGRHDGAEHWEDWSFWIDNQREEESRRPGYALIDRNKSGEWRGVLFFDGMNHYPKAPNAANTPNRIPLREAKEILREARRESGVSWWQQRWSGLSARILLLSTSIPCLPQFNEDGRGALLAGIILGVIVVAASSLPRFDNWWRRAGVNSADWPRGGALGG